MSMRNFRWGSRKAVLTLVSGGVLAAGGVACDDEVIFENEPPVRSGLFERTDRVFEDQDKFLDEDGNDICVNNINDLLVRFDEIAEFRNSNNNPDDDVTVEQLTDRLTEFLTDPAEIAGSIDLAIGGVPKDNEEQISKDVIFLLAVLGTSNSLLGDLTQTPRQGIEGRDDLIGFPDEDDGPLFGSKECSPATKLWAGGYYKATKMPPTMGEWCEKYGFEANCQNGNIRANDGKDLKISYFNAHALPVFRITLCNNDDFVREEKGFKGVGFGCVNLNYICEERVKPGVIADATLEQITGETKGSANFREAVNALELGLNDTIEVNGDPVSVICDNPEQDVNCNRCEAVSVTMHYDFVNNSDPRPTVVFGAYRGVDNTAPLMDRIDLSFNGIEEPFEVIPNICNSCHAGHPYEPKDPANPSFEDYNIQSQFLPINYRFALQDAAELKAFLDNKLIFNQSVMTDAPRAERPDDVRLFIKDNNTPAPFFVDASGDLEDSEKINKFITDIDPLAYTGFATDGLNKSFGAFVNDAIGNDELDAIELHDDDEIPDGWKQGKSGKDGENFYRIVGEHCNDGCHIALPPPLDFQSFDNFKEYRETILRDLCQDYSMPHSPEAFFLFWSRSERVTKDPEDNIRLNKNKDYELVDFADRKDELEDGNMRGDVELFLEFEGPGWEPLINDLEDGLDSCDIPPMATTFIRTAEITNFAAIAGKRDKCIEELKGERFGRLFCRTLCDPKIFSDEGLEKEGFIFLRTAEITRDVCENLADSIDNRKFNDVDDLGLPGQVEGLFLIDNVIDEDEIDRGNLLEPKTNFKKTAKQFRESQGLKD